MSHRPISGTLHKHMSDSQSKYMKAVLVKHPGGPEQLIIEEVPQPVTGAEELLVKVKATALNRADLLQRQGRYPPPPGSSDILGLEMSGVVEEVGKDCTGWKTGDEVFGLLPGGGYADYTVIHHRMAMRKPENLSFEDTAAIPEVFLTAFQALVWLGNLQKGESILIHAGASGVGTAAIQLAKHIGAKIIITAGSQEKIDACISLGADEGINYKKQNFQKPILQLTDQKGVNLILDFVGEPYWKLNLEVLATDGRLVILSTMGGAEISFFSLRQIMQKRATIMGSTLRNRPLSYKIKLTESFSSYALPLFKKRMIRPVIDTVFPWEKVQEAHRYMEENRNTGKIVLRVS
jgi:tumor protein p53-inducible protein 3